MTVTLFFINWNDAFYLPFIKRHYGQFCERIVMYDNHSTDNSVELARSLGFEVRTFGTPGVLSDADYLTVKNNCWKGCKTDWVIVCDADEFVNVSADSSVLFASKRDDKTIIHCEGYHMYSCSIPESDITEINTGVRDVKYDKPLIFNPRAIAEINYVPGCHRCNPIGKVHYSGFSPALLHYRFLNGPATLLARHRAYRQRLSQQNIDKGWGTQYLEDENIAFKKWIDTYNQCKPVF